MTRREERNSVGLSAIIIAMACLAMTINCSPADVDCVGVARVRLPQEIPGGLQYVTLVVSGPGMDDIERRVDLGSEQGPIVISLRIPAGPDRRFLCRAFGEGDLLYYQGEASRDVEAGSSIEVNVEMIAMAHVEGTIYQPGASGYPGDPLADFGFEGDEEHPAVSTDDQGGYWISLALGEYSILIQAEQGWAEVPVDLTSPGDVLGLDIYLVSPAEADFGLFAVIPMAASIGETIVLHGVGFAPQGAPPPEVMFGDVAPISADPIEYDDSHALVQIPAGLSPGAAYIQIYQSIWAEYLGYSNFIRIEIQ